MPDDFTHQWEIPGSQWVNLIPVVVAISKAFATVATTHFFSLFFSFFLLLVMSIIYFLKNSAW